MFRTRLQPVNRIAHMLPPPGKQLRRPAPARPVPQPLRARPEEPITGAMLASLGLALLALVTFSLLWPVTFVAVVLLLAVVCPIVSVGAGVRAILEHGR